jgi:polysaccharide export outer membrane protein
MKAKAVLIALFTAFVCTTGALVPAFGQIVPAKKPEKKYIPYKITRGDSLTVTVLNEPDLTAPQKRVEGTGTINLPLVQDVRVYGLTVGEAQEVIATAYREGRFLKNPVVTVTIETYAPRTIIIGGKVNIPGRQEIPPDTEWTLKDAISKAGLGDTARGKAVTVTRIMPDGSQKTFILDVESALKGRATNKDAEFVLEPDDTIYVPEKMI